MVTWPPTRHITSAVCAVFILWPAISQIDCNCDLFCFAGGQATSSDLFALILILKMQRPRNRVEIRNEGCRFSKVKQYTVVVATHRKSEQKTHISKASNTSAKNIKDEFLVFSFFLVTKRCNVVDIVRLQNQNSSKTLSESFGRSFAVARQCWDEEKNNVTSDSIKVQSIH